MKYFLENVRCKVCGESNDENFVVKYKKDELNIVQCKNCNFVFIPPYYRKEINYVNYKDEKVFEAIKRGNDWLKYQRHFLRYKLLKKYVVKGGNLFDLGVGWGHFLNAGRMLGYNVSGIEIAKMPYRYAKEYLKLPVDNIDFFDYQAKQDYYDIITMWDVLEHIDNCDEVIKRCNGMLKKGGFIILQVPQIDSFFAKRQKENWQAMGLDHVNYFSKETIKRLLKDKGFKTVKIKSSIELKLFLMYSFLDKKNKKIKDDNLKIEHVDRQNYFNKVVDKPKWILKILVIGHNIIYNILSFLRIGDEMIVIGKKV